MAVLTGGSAVSSPPCVSNTSVRLERLLKVWLALRNKFLQLNNLANFFVSRYFFFLVSINGQSRRIVASVLESRKPCSKERLDDALEKKWIRQRVSSLTIEKSVKDELAVPFDEVVDVAENSTARNLACHG